MDNSYDIVQYVEKVFGIKLLEYQKELLRQMDSGKQTYIHPAFYINELVKDLFKEKK